MQKICLIIPCYNEDKRFNKQHFLEFFLKNPLIDFCFVNDGSSDNTEAMLSALSTTHSDRITLVNLRDNVGKAEAIRKAVLVCLDKGQYDYVGYIDADFSAPLYEVNHIIAFCKGELSHYIIAGSRIKRLGAVIKRSPVRHYLGRVFATFASLLLKLPVYDSQCGLKLIRANIASALFKDPFITKWLFDLELWFRLRNLVGLESAGLQTLEVPLTDWQEKKGSKIQPAQFLKAPLNLVKIHFKYNTSSARPAKAQ
jgi:glycosyltransferase involved in cell wall biosynthesis